MTDLRPPRDNLVRAMSSGYEVSEGRTLSGHFARFNEWALIDSAYEGKFMERILPGAFKETLATKGNSLRILFQHGKDPTIGDQPIAVPTIVREDSEGAYYEAELLDGVPPLIVDGLRKGVYGSSFRFRVRGEDFNRKPKASAHNPDALPERTVRAAEVFEFGPVTFPAYAGATVSLRSMTDEFVLDAISSDPARLRDLVDYLNPDAPTERAEASPHPAAGRTDRVISSDPPERKPMDYVTREEKASRVTELRDAIARQAVEHPGVLPAEAQAIWDADNAELDELERDIAAWDSRQARLSAYASDPAKTVAAYSPPAVIRTKNIDDIYDLRAVEILPPEQRTQTLRDNALRSIDSAIVAKDADLDALTMFVEHRDSVDQEAARRILLTGSPAYKRAFAKYLLHGSFGIGLTQEESRAAALAVTGTTTTGGFAVPYIFDPTLIHIGAHTSINPYRTACRVETITGGNNWRAVTATAITAKWDAEAAASVEGGPTIGQPTFTVQRADAFATVSIETLQDRPDITGELSSLFSESKDTLEENSFTLGAGTTVFPFGMFTTLAFTNLDTATNDVTAIADMRALEADLPLRHRMNAAFFMSRSTQRQLEALDTTGYYFKRPGQFFAAGSTIPNNVATGNTGTQLLGYPVWEVPSAVSTLTTDGAIIVVFGDPRNYVIVDRIGLSVEVVPTMLNGATPSFPTGQRGIYCYWRATARPLNVDGMRSLSVQ